MRYIGNKTKLLESIDIFLESKGLLKKGLTFFDAFSGTASVGHHYKDTFKLIANDSLYFAYVIAQAKLNSTSNMFELLGFDPFDYFNNKTTAKAQGFIYNNYAPTVGNRTYFSDENALFIDYIRQTINTWFVDGKITEQEKYFLIASLIEGVSTVANIAGVYGACLSFWDPRALKKMIYNPIDVIPYVDDLADVHNDDIMNVIKVVKGDILYLDPPYTKNQYSTQYHLLETIAKYDSPEIKGKGGSRDMSSLSSVFSKEHESHNAFERLIALADFKHILFSYSTDGLMSKDFIEAVMTRYGKPGTYSCVKIPYKRYKNSKAEDNEEHCEYLFYIEKEVIGKINIQSPLNYIGGKADMLMFLKENMPKDISTFYDLFGGGCNVGCNVKANRVVYNDINFKVKELLEYIAQADIVDYQKYLSKMIKKYGLKGNAKEAYIKLREKYNGTEVSDRDLRDLFLLIMYGFQQQIRFNNKYDYNNPVGQACFNDKIREKLISFSNNLKEKNITFFSEDYMKFLNKITKEDFVYLDPPYLITLGSYNDGKRGFNGWNAKEEERLLGFVDELNAKGVKFMISNVIYHKDKENSILKNWVEKNGFNLISYTGKARGDRQEVIITNYKEVE